MTVLFPFHFLNDFYFFLFLSWACLEHFTDLFPVGLNLPWASLGVLHEGSSNSFHAQICFFQNELRGRKTLTCGRDVLYRMGNHWEVPIASLPVCLCYSWNTQPRKSYSSQQPERAGDVDGTVMYWVGQKVCLVFSIKGKTYFSFSPITLLIWIFRVCWISPAWYNVYCFQLMYRFDCYQLQQVYLTMECHSIRNLQHET